MGVRALSENDHLIRTYACNVIQSSGRRAIPEDVKGLIASKLKEVQDFIDQALGEPTFMENSA